MMKLEDIISRAIEKCRVDNCDSCDGKGVEHPKCMTVMLTRAIESECSIVADILSEIDGALKSNYKARDRNPELTEYCNGKIDALRGLDYYIRERYRDEH